MPCSLLEKNKECEGERNKNWGTTFDCLINSQITHSQFHFYIVSNSYLVSWIRHNLPECRNNGMNILIILVVKYLHLQRIQVRLSYLNLQLYSQFVLYSIMFLTLKRHFHLLFQDIHECSGTNDCDPTTSTCSELPGSYECNCTTGYYHPIAGDHRNCARTYHRLSTFSLTIDYSFIVWNIFISFVRFEFV